MYLMSCMLHSLAMSSLLSNILQPQISHQHSTQERDFLLRVGDWGGGDQRAACGPRVPLWDAAPAVLFSSQWKGKRSTDRLCVARM